MLFFAIVFLLCSGFGSSHKHFVRQKSQEFQSIIRQKINGNNVQQCPCVLHPESKKCISYDSRYLAVNIEEAMLTFLDLRLPTYEHPFYNPQTAFSCVSQECRNCFSALYYQLQRVNFIPRGYRTSIPLLPQASVRPDLCARFNFRPSFKKQLPVPAEIPSYVQSLVQAGERYHATHSGRRSQQQQQSNSLSASAASASAAAAQQFRNLQQIQQRQNIARQNNLNAQRIQQELQRQRQQFQNQQQLQLQQERQRQFQQQQFQQQQFLAQQRLLQQQQQQQFLAQQQRQLLAQQPQTSPQLQWNGRFWQSVQNPQVSQATATAAASQPWNGVAGEQQWGTGTAVATGPVIPPAATAPAAPGWGSWLGGLGNIGGGFGGGGGGQKDPLHALLNTIIIKRTKRANDVIGRSFQLSCTNRGESEDDKLNLCGTCWTWRQLPENYFPRIINELSCKEDDFCLSGWGECAQQYRNVDVMRNENGRWIPTVITTATCCDCRVRAGTEIHALVVGGKK